MSARTFTEHRTRDNPALRCGHRCHGVLVEPGLLEVRCTSKLCGAKPGTVVLHRFDALTGELVRTLTFTDPDRNAGGPA